MNRLHAEWQRLYLPLTSDDSAVASADAPLARDGHTRALVLELARPAEWTRLGAVWRAVQAELALPAPGIAVNGRDGSQLWFSLSEPVPLDVGAAFLRALCARYLPDVPTERLRWFPGADAAPARVPGLQPASGRWSAYVAPDLAPIFDEDPWLDRAPGDAAQADLLARLAPTPAADFQRALAQLMPAPVAAAAAAKLAPGTGTPPGAPAGPIGPIGPFSAPRDFLQAVMNDPAVPLALRIEAARALLGAGGGTARPD